MRLILASASPRRAELLTSAGFDFEVVPAEVDEVPQPGESPRAYALRVARSKANHVLQGCRESGTLVLGADTDVVVEGEILGKPRDAQDAKRMLKRLSGAVHTVISCIVLKSQDGEYSDIVETRVRLLPLSEAEIDWYIASGEPEGKAGAYAIQGRAARFIDHIDGSWSNVVGLPLASVYRLMKEAGAVIF
jgi:septum formation protein